MDKCSVCLVCFLLSDRSLILCIGNGRLEAFCFDQVKRMCTIRGKLKNRVWINSVSDQSIVLTYDQGDIVLIGLREFGDEKADVIMKYYDDEAKELKELGELPEHVKINEGDFGFEDEDGFEFVEEGKEEEDLDIDNI